LRYEGARRAGGRFLFCRWRLVNTLFLSAAALKFAHRRRFAGCRNLNAGRKDKTVNKADLIAKVANDSSLPKAQAAGAVDAVLDAITGALRGGDEVKIAGFGTFSVAHRAASTGRNPKTGEPIQIAATKLPKFKAGKGLKDAVK
jgi:DNA-binding protein HU-beta